MGFSRLKFKNLIHECFDKLTPSRLPDLCLGKAESIQKYLSYEGSIGGKRPTFLMSDCALGNVWELSLLAHEAMSETILTSQVSALCQIFANTRSPKASFQIVFDSSPSSDFERPIWFDAPDSIARRVQAARIKVIAEHAKAAGPTRVMKRRAFLCLRLEDEGKGGLLAKYPNVFSDNEHATIGTRVSSFVKHVKELESISDSVEDGLSRAGFTFSRVDSDALVSFCRSALHDLEFSASSPLLKEQLAENSELNRELLKDFIEARPYGVQVGRDTWESLSWLEKPPSGYCGLMAKLLALDVPLRAVVNIRQVSESQQLENKLFFLKNSNDSQSERQRSEIKQTLDRIEYGESLFSTALHILVRNENKSLDDIKDAGVAKKTLETVYSYLGVPLIHEKFSAPAIFFACLPLCYSPALSQFISREKRVLHENLGFFLPLYCGFKGTGNKLKMQIMQNRAGEVLYLSSRSSETSPHVALLSGSGGGKSFFLSNFLVSEIAANKNSLHFLVDRRTSYEILARTLGEEIGFSIAKPPESFPNIFKGRLDEEGDRLRTIVNVLTTAISLVSEGETVDAVKTNLLSLATQKTFSDLDLDARTRFDGDHFESASKGRAPVPKLSDVVDNLLPVCEKEGYEKENVSWLRQRLSPFYGRGPYANLFDRLEFNEDEDATPGISLFDVDGVSGDKILTTLTTLVIISEILRQVKRPENRGRLGTITIEEAGVINSSSTELINFIEMIWKVFRKLGYVCIGVTNDSRDYKFKAAPRTIWRMSPNKIVLRMLAQDIEEALSNTQGEPALFTDALTGKLIGSLHKKDGAYSQALWSSDETMGTFTFKPTGFDYYLAASKPEEVESVKRLAEKFSNAKFPFFEAVSKLAEHYPFGIRNKETGAVRAITDEEILELTKEGATYAA